MVEEESILGFELQEFDPVPMYHFLAYQSMEHFDCHLSWAYHNFEGLVSVGSPRALMLLVVAILAVLVLFAVVEGRHLDIGYLGTGLPSRKGHIPTY